MKRSFVLWFLTLTFVEGYKTFYMKEIGGCSTNLVEINVGSLSHNSSGILKNAFKHTFIPGLNCSVFIRPPLSYGIVVSIKSIDLLPAFENYQDCENYLEIFPTEHHESIKLCGYSFDSHEVKSFSHLGGLRVSFHTSNNTLQTKASFQLTFTTFRKEDRLCSRDEIQCRNHNCIWKGLTCDGHNNCGDLSDELDKVISQCSSMTPAESLAVILVTIAGSLILLVLVAYLRGPKLTRQIERLSQPRLSPDVPTIQDRTPIRAVPVINRVRTSYGSTSRFLSSYDNEEVEFRDPPPRYEDLSPPSTSVHVIQVSQMRSPDTNYPQVSRTSIPTNVSLQSQNNYTNSYTNTNSHGS